MQRLDCGKGCKFKAILFLKKWLISLHLGGLRCKFIFF